MTDNENRKNVIEGLECCLDRLIKEEREIEERGVVMSTWQDRNKNMDAIRDALALLKAQEPRVMTLDELSEKTDVWFESLVYDTIDPALSSGSYDDGTVGLMTLEEELFYLDEADYGTKWRCWTSRPTDEHREATPWE